MSNFQPTRREFVKNSSRLVAGGAALVSGLDLARAAYVGGDDEIKVAVIGCGGRGTAAAAQALSTEGNVTLWAMADAFGKRLESSLKKIRRKIESSHGADTAKQRINVPPERRFVGFDAYQSAIDSGVDLIILATPPGFRPIHIEAAIAAGKHLFTEKPLAVDAPGIRRVLAAAKVAKQKGLAVGVGLQRHHDPAYLETVQRIHDGAIGNIVFARAYWNSSGVWTRTRTDFAEAYGHEPSEMEYQMNNWYYFNWLCGDHIVEQHIHNLDVINWIKGGPPVSARGMGGREVRRGKDNGQIFDHHFVEFTYKDGCTLMSQCRHQKGCWNHVDEYVTGTAGSAHVGKFKITSADGEWSYQGKRVDPYQQEHDDLFAAIRRGESYNELEVGAASTMTAILGRMATYSGQELEWEEALNSTVDLSPSKYDFAATPPVVPDEEGNYPVPVPGKTKVV